MKTQYIKMCETVKAVKRGKFLSLNAYIGKEETPQVNNLTPPPPPPPPPPAATAQLESRKRKGRSTEGCE